MSLRTKVLLLNFCIMILVLVCIGVVLPSTLQEKNLQSVQSDTINQLKHIDFALSNFFKEVENDIHELLMHQIVKDPDDSGFTNFLNASEETFVYTFNSRESAIIADLNAFRLTHPYVNSVYIQYPTIDSSLN